MKIHTKSFTTPVLYPPYAGVVVAQFYTLTIPAGASTGDIVELGVLPNACRLVDAKIVNDAAGVTADIGFVTGTVGSKSTDRTCGNELFGDIDLNTPAIKALDTASAFRLATDANERAVGLKIKSGTPTTGTLTLILQYQA